MFLFKGARSVVSSVTSGISSGAGLIVSTATNTVGTVAVGAYHYSTYLLGYAEVPAAVQTDVNLTPEQAFEKADTLGIEDYVAVKQYYSIVFASDNPAHETLKLKARCRLACMIAQYSIQKNDSSDDKIKLDDYHGLLLAKAKEVNKLLLDIYESNPAAPSESWVATADIAALKVSFSVLQDLIKKCVQSFAKDHEAFPFDRRNEVSTRWASWEMMLSTFNVTHSWFQRYFEKNNTSVALILPNIQFQEILYAICLNEVTRLSTAYAREEIVSSAVLTRLHEVTGAFAQPASTNRSEQLKQLEKAIDGLKQRTLRDSGMQEYAAFLQKSLEDRQSPEATKTLKEIKERFEQAQCLAALDESAKMALQDIEQKLVELDASYAETNIEFYVKQSKEKLKELPSENVSPEDLLEQITWIKNRQKVLVDYRAKPFASSSTPSGKNLEETLAASKKALEAMQSLDDSIERLINAMSEALKTKEKAFYAALDEPASKIAKEIVDASLITKKQKSRSLSATIMSKNPLEATFSDEDRIQIESLVASYFLNHELMMNFYKGSEDQRKKSISDLKEFLPGLYSYNGRANTITFKVRLDETVKNSIKGCLTFPVAKAKAAAGATAKK